MRRIQTWDLEWVPDTYELRLCGTYDKSRGYRSYKTIRKFLEKELIPENTDKWFYAHFGGMADLQFLINEFVDSPFTVRAAFSGASAVVCYVRHGKYKWVFVDSYWLLRSPLRDIAISMGMEKTGPTESMSDKDKKEWYSTVDYKTLEEYNRNDCIVLYEAIIRAESEILELGGQLQMTLASTALQLFRRKYLKEDIGTSAYINETARKTYFASRVEVLQRDVDYPGLYYDVNSSFPYAMTFPLPGRLRGNYAGCVPSDGWDREYPFIADCEVEIKDVHMPPLPYRLKNRVFFPIGRWRNWFSGIDLFLLLREGGRIIKVYESMVFEPFYDLAEYAQDLYARRKDEKDPFRREFFKLLLNACYGKFAEGPEKTTMIINPTTQQLNRLVREMDMLAPGIFFHHSEVPIPHAHVPVSSYITAIARRTLFDYMQRVSEVHYCDTDGFSTTADDILTIGKELGAIKLEKTFERATFVVPKLYRWFPGNNKPPVVKAKGFSLGRDKEQANKHFEHLIEGGEIEVDRMMRIKEMMHYCARHEFSFGPHNVIGKGGKPLTKALRQIYENEQIDKIGKRFLYPDGLTRPWTVEELETAR